MPRCGLSTVIAEVLVTTSPTVVFMAGITSEKRLPLSSTYDHA
jgi:hypothetical protein